MPAGKEGNVVVEFARKTAGMEKKAAQFRITNVSDFIMAVNTQKALTPGRDAAKIADETYIEDTKAKENERAFTGLPKTTGREYPGKDWSGWGEFGGQSQATSEGTPVVSASVVSALNTVFGRELGKDEITKMQGLLNGTGEREQSIMKLATITVKRDNAGNITGVAIADGKKAERWLGSYLK